MPSIQKINGIASDTISKINGTNDALLTFMNVNLGNVESVDRNIPFFNSHSIDLDGSSDYIDLANNIDLVDTDSGAVSMWVKLDASSANAYLFQLSSDTSASNNRMIIYWSHGNSKIGYTLKYGGANAQYNWASTGMKGDGAWHHVAMIWGPHSEEGTNMTACFDGACQTAIQAGGDFAGSAAAMTLGRASTGASSFMDGHIDEVTIWDTSEGGLLDANDIDILYNNGKGCVTNRNAEDYTSSGQVAIYHKMEENTGTTVANSAVALGNTATVSASDLWTNDTF